jgi:glutathione-regulated potassium-efflux system protein KefB
MQEGDFIYQAFIYLSAAVIAVPVAKKLGLGSVLGYLLAGVMIGPFIFGLVGEEGQDVMHFAEFGVVMMLFLVGLELQPSLLWKMRWPILGLGGLQVGITAGLIMILILVMGFLPWQTALAIGLTLALSSTAIVLQTLNEKNQLKTEAGQNAFSVLLFQDIAVIPILAIIPLLAIHDLSPTESQQHLNWIDGLPLLTRTALILGVITSIVVAGRYLMSYAFRWIAQTHLRELFTAAALLLIIAITLLMTKVGLSPALGTFLAGVVLAQSEYRHELESNIEPFKGLLLGLFFIAVGASIDFDLILSQPLKIAFIVLALIALKLFVLGFVGKIFGMRLDSNLLFAFALAQGGEFAFVLLSFALQNGVVEIDIANPLIAAVAISMALTPLLIILNEKLIQPYFGTKEKEKAPADEFQAECPVIIAGFGSFGSTIGRFMQANGVQATYLDKDPNHVELLRKMGFKVFYGDASRQDLLHAAGADKATLLLIAVEDTEKALKIIRTAQKHFPNLKILSRTNGWEDSYEMLDAGIEGFYREYLDSSLRMAADALGIIGHRKYQVQRAMRTFRKHDEHFLRVLAKFKHIHHEHIQGVKQMNLDMERMMRDDTESIGKDKDLGWDALSRKEEFKTKQIIPETDKGDQAKT